MTAVPVYFEAGMIRGARLTWNSTSEVGMAVGQADVNGALLSWSAALTLSKGTVANSTLYYVYLYSNSGVATLEKSTTVPVWNATTQQFQKTGDATRRGSPGWFFATSSTGDVLRFDQDPIAGGARTGRMRYIASDISAGGGELGLLSGGQTVDGSTPLSFGIGAKIPPGALSAHLRVQLFNVAGVTILAAASVSRSSTVTTGDPLLSYAGVLQASDYPYTDGDVVLNGSGTLYYVTYSPTQADASVDVMALGCSWER